MLAVSIITWIFKSLLVILVLRMAQVDLRWVENRSQSNKDDSALAIVIDPAKLVMIPVDSEVA